MDPAVATGLMSGDLSKVLGAMAVLLVVAVVTLFKINSTCNRDLVAQRIDFEMKLEKLNDARVELLERALTALERNTMTLEARNSLLSSANAIAEATSQAIAKMSITQENAIRNFADQLGRVEGLCNKFNDIVRPT